MTVANPTRQKADRSTLDRIFTDASNVWVIHYSCESFYDPPEGRSPRITSIALRKLDSAQTVSFSIHKVAEIKGYLCLMLANITTVSKERCFATSTVICRIFNRCNVCTGI